MRTNNITFLWIFAALGGLSFYISNPGGVGLAMPNNIITYLLMTGLILSCWLRLPLRAIRVTETSRLIMCAMVVLLVPLFYTRPEWLQSAGWRALGLFTGVFFYFMCLQLRLQACWQRWVVYLIIIAAGIQALLALLQLFLPGLADAWAPLATRRAVGIFQQPNLLASFLATGLALTLMVFLLPGFALRQKYWECCRSAALGVMLAVFPATLVWGQSRTGWLAGILLIGLFLLYYGRRMPWRCCLSTLPIAAGVLMAIGVMQFDQNMAYQPHDGSDQARSAMLFSTLQMIAEKPWLGWGYGGFEYSFQHFRLAQGLSTEGVGIARHPHNELLLWWVEGGMVGLTGMLLLIVAGIFLLLKAWRYDSVAFHNGKDSAGQGMALCFSLLPILLHTQTEYPFYLSAIHWMVFLLLLAMLDRLVSPTAHRYSLPTYWQPLVGSAVFILSAAGMAIMVMAFYTGMLLTQSEKQRFNNMDKVLALPVVLTWVHKDRWQFDRHLYGVLRFNQTGDEKLLEGYTQWAQDYLKYRIDKNVYANLLIILRYQKKLVEADALHQEAELLFPSDPRFK
ncbi:Wzy polymerase domain-containing protein [Serratia sp. NA_112.1]|uniref:Wzy polymerase domain-containing protein n=1 Tax=unclassified Serratia (in: enterobacteria) TaxID=2647522 RepID=UPI004046CA0E